VTSEGRTLARNLTRSKLVREKREVRAVDCATVGHCKKKKKKKKSRNTQTTVLIVETTRRTNRQPTIRKRTFPAALETPSIDCYCAHICQNTHTHTHTQAISSKHHNKTKVKVRLRLEQIA
jgi:hypothetical protein